jgi:hypothetical protein
MPIPRLTSGARQLARMPENRKAQAEHEDYGYALIFGNVILMVLVAVCFHFQHSVHPEILGCSVKVKASYCYGLETMFDRPRPSYSVLAVFLVVEVATIVVYWIHGFVPENLWAHITGGMRTQEAKRQEDPDERANERKGLHFPMAVTVLPNAAAIGYLVHATGGPSASPYAAVLIAALIISQQTRELESAEHGRNPFTDLRASAQAYAPFLIIAAMFYGALGLAQVIDPAKVAAAPGGLTIFIAIVLLVIGTLANYIIGSDRSKQFAERVELVDTESSDPDLDSEEPENG